MAHGPLVFGVMALFQVENGFRLISFKKISVLDSNFIHRYVIKKCRSINCSDE